MAEARAANPLVDQFKKGAVPKELRLMAAQGALPLKPADLIELLHHLLRDREEDVRAAASGTLRAHPIDELLPIFRDKETPPAVLAWGLAHREEKELREAVLQNVATPDDAIREQAPTLPEALAELVVINQVRLLRNTPLLEALESNPSLNNDQKRRLRELRETFRIGVVEQPPPPPTPEAPAQPPSVEAPAEEALAEETLEEVEGPPLSEDEAVVEYLSEEERGQADKVSAVQKIYRMSTAQKVVAALKGTREERAILIRDRNRLVATAVLGSPRVTEAEVESFAAMRNVSDEVLRQIGNNREWTKKYAIVASLVKNPRTPLGISLGFVPRMNPRDIKSLAQDRNVPEPIRKQAQRFIKAQQEPKEKK